MYSKELEELIENVLEDGVITEQKGCKCIEKVYFEHDF